METVQQNGCFTLFLNQFLSMLIFAFVFSPENSDKINKYLNCLLTAIKRGMIKTNFALIVVFINEMPVFWLKLKFIPLIICVEHELKY